MRKIIKKYSVLFVFLFLLFLLAISQNVEANTYLYTATDFYSTGCPYGSELETSIKPLPPPFSDIVKILGIGLGSRNLTDGVPEGIYIPHSTTDKLYTIERSPSGSGIISWGDSEIRLELKQGFGSSLGSYIILRRYSSIDDNQGTCVRGTLMQGNVCISFTYSDWTDCQLDGTQTRTIINSSPNDCSGGNPILTQSCIPPCIDSNYSCDDWGNCSINGNQTRTCNKISSCEGGVQMPTTLQDCTYIQPICTSWTYSGWSDCQSNSTQTRTITNSSPDNCSGGDPTLTQSCNYVPLCTANDYSCDDWSACSRNNRQTRTCEKTASCQGGVSSPATTKSCTYTPSCSFFLYSGWSECTSDGKQTRSVTYKYPYNCEGGESLKTTQSCTYIPPCNADTWTCGSWGSCSPSGTKTRSCRKTFDCPSVETAVPEIVQYCTPPNLDKYQVSPANQYVVNQDNIIKATVSLWCLQTNERWYKLGSGTIIDSSGTILTNKHVVSNTIGCRVGFVNSYKDEPYFNNKQIAFISRISTNADIATLKLINPYNRRLTYIDILKGNSDVLRLGDKISTYGYPTDFGSKITSTRGEFAGVEGDFLKTSAIIDKGNSGGGAYLQDGSFIGIPTRVFTATFNVLGGILSINKVKSWLSNAPMTYNDKSYNEYSRVSSILENIDLKKIDTLKVFISDTDEKGNDISPIPEPAANQNSQNIEELEPEGESIIIESDDPDQASLSLDDEQELKQKKSIKTILKNIFTAIKNFFIKLFGGNK